MDWDHLPIDALRRVLSYLDWRSAACCAAVCTTWRSAAAENSLWQPHVCFEYSRPSLLAHSAAHQAAGWQQQTTNAAEAAAAASALLLLHAQPASGKLPEHGLLKRLFAAGLAHAAAPHQALLARFHAALAQITGWRVVFSLNDTAPAPASQLSDAPVMDTLSLSDGDPQGSSTHSTNAAAAAAAAEGPVVSAPGQAAGGSSNRQHKPLCGHPAPLSLQALQAGGWAVGCVQMQQQEQSCWVRFNLPPQLVADPQVEQAVHQGRVAAVLQGLGPAGWFDLATAERFQLSDVEMDILLQSHRTGFYAWDQLEEGGVDRYGQLEPLPWDIAPGNHQQQQQQPFVALPPQQQHVPAPIQQQQPAAAAGVAAAPPQQQQQPGVGSEGESDDEGAEGHELRMLAYVHYEQLLQVLPWPLPQSLPLPPAPALPSPQALAQHLLAGPCALWLQLDVCQLHGGHKLGSCIAPLRVWDWDAAQVHFRCIEEQLLVVLYQPNSGANSTQGLGPPQQPATGAGQAAAGAASSGPGDGAAAAASRSCKDAAAAAAAAGLAAAACLKGVLGQEACRQVLLGSQCLHGAGSCSEDGSVVRTAADALGGLMDTDEIMVDFALFDANGHLLMGRAGIEVWAKQAEDDGYIDHHAQGAAPGGCSQDITEGATLSAGPPQQWQLLQCRQPSLGLAVRELAVQIGPVTTRHALGAPSTEAHRRSVALALQREQRLLAWSHGVRESQLEQEAAQLGHAQRASFARTVQKLHFLVDGVNGYLWDSGVVVDTRLPPPGFVPLLGGSFSTVSMTLTMSNLRGLFRLPPLRMEDFD